MKPAGHEAGQAKGHGNDGAEQKREIRSLVLANFLNFLPDTTDILLHLGEDVLGVLGNLLQNGDARFDIRSIRRDRRAEQGRFIRHGARFNQTLLSQR